MGKERGAPGVASSTHTAPAMTNEAVTQSDIVIVGAGPVRDVVEYAKREC